MSKCPGARGDCSAVASRGSSSTIGSSASRCEKSSREPFEAACSSSTASGLRSIASSSFVKVICPTSTCSSAIGSVRSVAQHRSGSRAATDARAGRRHRRPARLASRVDDDSERRFREGFGFATFADRRIASAAARWPRGRVPIPRETVREVLVRCRDFTLPLTLIVGNRGMTQQCVSTPRTVHHAGSLLTLRGSDCALQVREDQVESAWIVRRPSTRGSSARLELYGHDGRNAVTIFGGPHHDARVAWAILVGCFAAGSDD